MVDVSVLELCKVDSDSVKRISNKINRPTSTHFKTSDIFKKTWCKTNSNDMKEQS